MKKAHFNQNIKNSISNVIDAIFLPLAALLVTPLFIHKLGIGEYGLWMFINTLIASVSILNIGGANVVIKYISAYRKEKNSEKIKQIFSTIFSLQIFIGLVILALAISVAKIIATIDLFDTNIEDKELFGNLILLSCGILIIKMSEQVITGFLKGYERYDISTMFSIFSKLILLLTQVCTVILGGDLRAILLNSLIILFVNLGIQMLGLKHFQHGLCYFKNFKISILVEILSFSWWIWLLSSTMIIVSQLDRWVISFLGGLEVLGYYSIAYMILNNIHMILSSSVAWVFPKVSKQGIDRITSKLFFKGHSFIVIASTLVSVTLIAFQDIFLIWLGSSTYNESISIIQTMLVITPIYSLSILSFYYINGVGYVKYNFYNSLVTGILRGLLMFSLFRYFGAVGIIYAIGLSSLIMSVHYVWIIKHKISIPKINLTFFLLPVLLYSSIMIAFINNVKYSLTALILIIPLTFYIVYKKELNLEFFKER